jgi:hypothetical protein
MKNLENPKNPKSNFPSQLDVDAADSELVWQNRLVAGISILVAGFLIYSKTIQLISWLMITKLVFLAVLAVAIPRKKNASRVSPQSPTQQSSAYQESTVSIIVRTVGTMIFVLVGLIALALLIFYLICVTKGGF